MKADLHIHTDISDGSFDIKETLKIAAESGLTSIAITNHDTVQGLAEAAYLGTKTGVEVLPGIEISAVDRRTNTKVHLLGYCFQPAAVNIRKLCEPTIQKRQEKSLQQIECLQKHGFIIDKDAILAKRRGKTIYKQHIMAELIDKGYTDATYSELYQSLFKGDGICAGDIEYADVFEAIKAIKADHGIVVLAHPGEQKTHYLIEELVAAGLDGIELIHEKNSDEDQQVIRNMAIKHNLILTGGSDFHGKYGTVKKLGGLVCPKEGFLRIRREADTRFFFIQNLVMHAGKTLFSCCAKTKEIMQKEEKWNNLVTNFDLETERYLVQEIKNSFPCDSFLTEEKTVPQAQGAGYKWIIDPIDGTTNFVSSGKDFTISVALYKNDRPILGTVYDVMADCFYFAINGGGAWLNGKEQAKENKRTQLNEAVIDYSLNTIEKLRRQKKKDLVALNSFIRGHRSYGVASLAICKIATGSLDAYLSAKLCLWDFAAAAIFLQEAGGCILVEDNGEQATTNLFVVACSDKYLLKELKNKIAELDNAE